LFKKGTTPVQNAAATSLLQELNLALIPGSITFEPSTTPDEVLASLAYLQSLNGFSIYRFARGVIPREGTALFHQYESEGCLVKTGYDYSICCKDARVQALFERLQYLAHLAYNFEKKNHERVSEQFSITQIPDRMKGSLRELEADLKRVVLTLAADCTTRLLSGDSDDPAQAPRAFAWLDGVFDERLKGLGV
ncbi:MAG: hypothetical protein FJY85_20320, partial [Deltaproteobacteria bacterium]|nr:hypothetical protein [Deltaproteobacteria bacterium]